jgi:hypothetical protein
MQGFNFKSLLVLDKPTSRFDGGKQNRLPSTAYNMVFSSSAIGATGFQMAFGDGDSSTLENPSHTYTKNGNFDVELM